MNKSYFSQLVNIIIIPLALNYQNLHDPAGLAGQTHDFQITAFLFMALFNFIYVPHRIMQVIRCIKPLRRLLIRMMTHVTG